MNWNQYRKRRRGMSLESFVDGCSNEQEALERFSYRRIEDPPIEEIKLIFQKPEPVVDPAPEEVVPDPNVSSATKKTKVTSVNTGE